MSPTPRWSDPKGGVLSRSKDRSSAHRNAMRSLAVASSLALVAGLAITTTPASAQPGGGSKDREQAFAHASAEFGVPQQVLEAVSYAQTHWEAHAGQHNTDGGYGPMNLIDSTLLTKQQHAARGENQQRAQARHKPAGHKLAKTDTLGRAAKKLGISRSKLRRQPRQNIRGGAALLAAKQSSLHLPTGQKTTPAKWYAAVASASGSSQHDTARIFADDVYKALASGKHRHTSDGQQMSMRARKVTPVHDQLRRLNLSKPRSEGTECPRTISCDWIPAPYKKTGDDPGDFGNHDTAHRDTKAGPSMDYIVLHDTEETWDNTLKLVQDPTYIGWHYTIRSSDGQVAQHIKTKDIGWHAGNYYLNQHSVGVEQEGYAAQGATWFTESLYRNSARLVRYLADRYDIPLDRAHIFGHDNVPGTTADTVKGMHWDPGPYWNWEHYFKLLGKPLTSTKLKRARSTGPWNRRMVRITPGFADNRQPVTGCSKKGKSCNPQGTNFVSLHTKPSKDSKLVKDIGLHPDGSHSTTDIADVGARAAAGQEYAMADRRGDWSAIWYLGQKAWFHDPAGDRNVTPIRGKLVVPRPGVKKVKTYGRAYPESSAYPDRIPDQGTASLDYTLPAGQSAVLTDAHPSTDYYQAATYDGKPPKDHIDIRGTTKYLQISIGHRVAYVKASDVRVVPARR